MRKKLERIRHSVDSLIIDGHPELHMSVSIGGAYGSGTAEKSVQSCRHYDVSIKKAKKQVTISFLGRDGGQRRQHLKRRNRDYESKRLLYKIWRRF